MFKLAFLIYLISSSIPTYAKLTENKMQLASKLFNKYYFKKYSKNCDLFSLQEDFKTHKLSNTKGYEFLRKLRKNKERAVNIIDISKKSALSYSIDTYLNNTEKQNDCRNFIKTLVKDLKVNITRDLQALLTDIHQNKDSHSKTELVALLLQEKLNNSNFHLQKQEDNVKKDENNKIKIKHLTKRQRLLLEDRFSKLSLEDIEKKYKATLSLGLKGSSNVSYKQLNIDTKGKLHLIFEDFLITIIGSYYQLDKDNGFNYEKESIGVYVKYPGFFTDNNSLVLGTNYRDNTDRDNKSLELIAFVSSTHKNILDVENLDLNVTLGTIYDIGEENPDPEMYTGLDIIYLIKKPGIELFTKGKAPLIGDKKYDYEIGVSKRITENASLELVHERDFEKDGSKVVDDMNLTSLKFSVDF